MAGKIVITGGVGFIGSACAVACLKAGWTVVVIDNFEETLYERWRKLDNLRWVQQHGDITFYETDIRNEKAIKTIFETHRPDVLLHLAAVAGVRPSIEKAAHYYDINVTGTSVLMTCAHETGVRRLSLASSSSVYGGNTKVPFAEDDPVTQPISPYAVSKRALELLASTHHHLYGGQISCLRFFTVYGPRQRPEMAIHKFMRLIDEGTTIPMFGDGHTGRDYTYIDDIVQGVMATLSKRDETYEIYNLGGDRVVRLKPLIDAIAKTVGKSANIQQLPMQPGDVLLTNADVSKARRMLGYEPQVSLEEGLKRMWRWYQKNHAPES